MLWRRLSSIGPIRRLKHSDDCNSPLRQFVQQLPDTRRSLPFAWHHNGPFQFFAKFFGTDAPAGQRDGSLSADPDYRPVPCQRFCRGLVRQRPPNNEMIISMHQNSQHRHHHRSRAPRIVAVALAIVPAFAQTFEVATVKPASPNAPGTMINWRDASHGHGFVAENYSLRQLITAAYGIRDHQLTGGPAWIGNDRFDIVGKPQTPAASGPEGIATLKLMLQVLLADRFHLTVRRDTREMPVYFMVVAKGGARLRESAPGSIGAGQSAGMGWFKASNNHIGDFVQTLAGMVSRSVIDKTGLTGEYDFRVDYAPDVSAAPEPGSTPEKPSLFTALQEQLGLKLEPGRAPVEMFVVEHAEKPTEN